MNDENPKKHIALKVYGNVQGVFYRNFIEDAARKYNINGFVCNRDNGIVYIEAEGDPEDLDRFVRKARQGSEMSVVKRIGVREGSVKDFTCFKIKH